MEGVPCTGVCGACVGVGVKASSVHTYIGQTLIKVDMKTWLLSLPPLPAAAAAAAVVVAATSVTHKRLPLSSKVILLSYM